MTSFSSPTSVGMYEAALISAIDAFEGTVSNLTDENNQPYSIPIRAEFSSSRAEFSEVVVGIRPGKITLGLGGGYAYQNPVTGGTVYQAVAQDSQLIMTVKARSPAERFLITDALVSAFLASYSVVNGYTIEQEVRTSLLVGGILAGTIETVEYREPAYDEQRPEGQVYEADLSIGCNISLIWETPPYVSNQYGISQTLWGATNAATKITV